MAAPQNDNFDDILLQRTRPDPATLIQYERDSAHDQEKSTNLAAALEHDDTNLSSGIWYLILVPVAIFRLIILTPIVPYWQIALSHDALIASDEHLPQKFATPIRSTEHTAATWSTVLFCWHCIILVPCLISIVPPFNLPVVVMDTLLAAYVSMILHQQEAYVPRYKSRCRGLRILDKTWSGDNGYFVYEAQRAGKPWVAEQLCSESVREWQYEIATVCVLVNTDRSLG
jgi:hypothetical protein